MSWVFDGQGGNLGATAVNYEAGSTVPTAFLLELGGTFFLVNTITNTSVAGKAGNLAPLAKGMTVAACIMMFGPLTGASLNPARTLGPAGAAGVYADLWVFLVATTLGAELAGALNRNFMNAKATR